MKKIFIGIGIFVIFLIICMGLLLINMDEKDINEVKEIIKENKEVIEENKEEINSEINKTDKVGTSISDEVKYDISNLSKEDKIVFEHVLSAKTRKNLNNSYKSYNTQRPIEFANTNDYIEGYKQDPNVRSIVEANLAKFNEIKTGNRELSEHDRWLVNFATFMNSYRRLDWSGKYYTGDEVEGFGIDYNDYIKFKFINGVNKNGTVKRSPTGCIKIGQVNYIEDTTEPNVMWDGDNKNEQSPLSIFGSTLTDETFVNFIDKENSDFSSRKDKEVVMKNFKSITVPFIFNFVVDAMTYGIEYDSFKMDEGFDEKLRSKILRLSLNKEDSIQLIKDYFSANRIMYHKLVKDKMLETIEEDIIKDGLVMEILSAGFQDDDGYYVVRIGDNVVRYNFESMYMLDEGFFDKYKLLQINDWR